MSENQLERLRRIMEIQSAEDHKWWDEQGIIDENKSIKEQINKELGNES